MNTFRTPNDGARITDTVYWVRVISFTAGATMQMDRGMVIALAGLVAYQAPNCAPWKEVAFTGTSVVEYDNTGRIPFPGPLANQGSAVDGANNALSGIVNSPNDVSGQGTRGGYGYVFKGNAPMAGNAVLAVNNVPGSTTRIKRLILQNPGTALTPGLAVLQIFYSPQILTGGTVVDPAADTNVLQRKAGTIAIPNQILIDTGAGPIIIRNPLLPPGAFAFNLYFWVPSAPGPFIPVIIDFDGPIIPMLEAFNGGFEVLVANGTTGLVAPVSNLVFSLEWVTE